MWWSVHRTQRILWANLCCAWLKPHQGMNLIFKALDCWSINAQQATHNVISRVKGEMGLLLLGNWFNSDQFLPENIHFCAINRFQTEKAAAWMEKLLLILKLTQGDNLVKTWFLTLFSPIYLYSILCFQSVLTHMQLKKARKQFSHPVCGERCFRNV